MVNRVESGKQSDVGHESEACMKYSQQVELEKNSLQVIGGGVALDSNTNGSCRSQRALTMDASTSIVDTAPSLPVPTPSCRKLSTADIWGNPFRPSSSSLLSLTFPTMASQTLRSRPQNGSPLAHPVVFSAYPRPHDRLYPGGGHYHLERNRLGRLA